MVLSLLILAFLVFTFTEILSGHNIILKKSTIYILIYIIGVYIPLSIACITFINTRTDTTTDFVFVLLSLILTTTTIIIYFIFLSNKRYNWICISIVIFTTFMCNLIAKKHLLLDMHQSILGGIIGTIFIIHLLEKELLKKRMKSIFSIILSTIILLMIIYNHQMQINHLSKPFRYAINEAEKRGYEITKDDNIIVFNYKNVDKFSPILVFITRIKDNYKITRNLQFEYFQDKIIKFKDKTKETN